MKGATIDGALAAVPMPRRRAVALATSLAALALAAFLSILVGARPVPLHDLWTAFAAFDPNDAEQIVVREFRVPRTLGGILVGAALGAAGALMQAVTRNPLADPGLLGVNAGATFGAVIPVWLLGAGSAAGAVWPALAGAFAASLLVWGLGAIGAGVLGLLLAGAAVSAFLFALVGGHLLVSQAALDVYRHWVLGSLDGLDLTMIGGLLPVLAVGFGSGALAVRLLDVLVLGEDVARALGTRVWLARTLSLVAIACLCAGAVSLAGPIGFIGLLVPHAARLVSGSGVGWTVLISALLGAILLLLADVLGRVLLPGISIQAGLTVAVIGGPAIVAMVRRGTMVPL